MYARVARWEDAEAEAIKASIDEIRSRSADGPPEGVPAKRLMVLADPDNGRTLVITMYDSMDDLEQGDQVFNQMTPPGDGMGTRSTVERYEVAIELSA